ncbi:MAG: histidine phosphatase family protein [Eubacteriales bacterium]|nr:histidine phosphatase family protein [Eubacteriales bacterium]
MITVYFTRHGETDWNKAMLIQGHVEIDLNEKGKQQAKEAHDKLLPVPIDLIFCSPLRRARETAEIIRGERDIPLLIDNRLIEEYYGDMEGKERKGEPYLTQRQCFFKRYPHGEGYLDVAQRVYNFFDDLKAKYDGKVKTVLIVAHGGMSRVVNTYFHDMDNEEFVHYGIKNCEIVKYQL